MADQYIAGKVGGVLVNGTAYSFGKWKVAYNVKPVPVNNFTSSGYQVLVMGFAKATLTISGPWNYGNMPLTVGTSYTFTLQVNGAQALIVTAYVTDLSPANDAEGTQSIDVTCESSGSFTGAIV